MLICTKIYYGNFKIQTNEDFNKVKLNQEIDVVALLSLTNFKLIYLNQNLIIETMYVSRHKI